MKNIKISLEKEYGLNGGELNCIIGDSPWDLGHEDWKRPALIVVPGGAYTFVSAREGEPVAFEFLARGYNTFILNYSVSPDEVYPEQLYELACAIDYLKKHANELNINPKEIFVVGFSAGGHLVADLAAEHSTISKRLDKDIDCTPTAIGLGYPVISTEEGYTGTHDNLLYGYTEEAREELLKTLNLNYSVNDKNPPAFIWTTFEDGVVPNSNSLKYSLALSKQKILYELHVYPFGGHGLSTVSNEVNDGLAGKMIKNRQWINNCDEFFHNLCSEKY